jgi:hypothetical protein
MLVMIGLILASKSHNLKLFHDSGWIHTLLQYATATETGQMDDLAKQSHFATACDEDFELKQILWMLLSSLSGKSSYNNLCLTAIAESNFVEALLMYLCVNAPSRRQNSSPITTKNSIKVASDAAAALHQKQPSQALSSTMWSNSQNHRLQILALNILSNLIPYTPIMERFVQAHGHVMVLKFIHFVGRKDEEACGLALLIMLQVITTPTIQLDIAKINGVEVMLSLFADTQRSSTIRRTASTLVHIGTII